MADGFLTFSQYAANELRTIHSIANSKIYLARMGINTKEFHPRPWARQMVLERYQLPPDAFLLGLAARLEPVKDVALAVQTMAIIREMGIEKAFLLIAGDGSQREELSQLSSKLGVGKSVLFLGRLENTRDVISGLDVYFQTTRGPNLGIAALEALASGVPLLIAARDNAEHLMAKDTLIDEASGWVVEAKPEVLARQISNLMHDSALLTNSKKMARRVAESYYDWDVHVKQVRCIYEKLIRLNRGGYV
jgi:glycosyltransferase involved in cell wall biosynthesis